MNRNTNAHFSEYPNVEISRSTFDRSFSHKLSGNVGDVIPIFYDEILPGDTVTMDTSKVIRFQTMLTPFMDNVYADVYWFFVPNRIVWDHWINFMGENTSSAWTPATEYSVPVLTVPPVAGEGDSPNNNKVGTILDYLGYPVAMSEQTDDVDINALPIRGYCKIMNDFFRDENLTDPINIYTGDNAVVANTGNDYVDDLPAGGVPFKAAKFADYFSSALPYAQKGSSVMIQGELSGDYPVVTLNKSHDLTGNSLIFKSHNYNNSSVGDYYSYLSRSQGHVGANATTPPYLLSVGLSGTFDTAISSSNSETTSSAAGDKYYEPVNLFTSMSGLGASFSVNDLRYAFQMQKLLERDARGGTRYIEVLKSHFNVDSPDQRLQRPEYLGGSRFPISVTQVSNTAQAETEFLGDLGANSVTTDVHSDFTKSFTEHGMLFGLMVLRYDHTYSQGLEKFWKRSSRFDYYWPVFANIGEQPIDKSELFLTGEGTFGYQEAWADYRYKPNRVSGEMRPYVSNSLASWHLGDDYDASPSLSDSWIREDKTNVDRVLAVTSETSNQFWADIYFNYRHTRPMPVYSIPGLIDHH